MGYNTIRDGILGIEAAKVWQETWISYLNGTKTKRSGTDEITR
jgi:hypothetical protein